MSPVHDRIISASVNVALAWAYFLGAPILILTALVLWNLFTK